MDELEEGEKTVKWSGLWHRSGDGSCFRCLHMVAWDVLSAADRVGVVAGQLPDGAQALFRFFVKLDAIGGLKVLVLEDREFISGRPIGFDKLDARILEVSRRTGDFIASMHEPAEWEIGQSLVLRAESAESLRLVSSNVLVGGETLDAVITRVVEAAGVVIAAPANAQAHDSSVECSACNAENDPEAKYCGNCGTKLVSEMPAQQSLREVPSIALEVVDFGLSAIPMEVEECAFTGPDEDGAYSGNVSVRVSNTSGHDWARATISWVLFNCAGIPIAYEEIDGGFEIPDAESDVWSSFMTATAAQVLGNPEKMHVAVTATAYSKQSYALHSVKLNNNAPGEAVSLGTITVPNTMAVLDLGITERAPDSEGNIELESYCVVQSIVSAPFSFLVETVVELTDANDETLVLSMDQRTTPGHFAVIGTSEQMSPDMVKPLTAQGTINVVAPVSYGCVQRQGALVTAPEADDSDGDEEFGPTSVDDPGHADAEVAEGHETTGYFYFRGTVARIPDNWSPATNEDDNGLIGIGLPPLDDDGSPDRVIFRCFISPTEFRWEADCAGDVEEGSHSSDDPYVIGSALLAVVIERKLGVATTTTLGKDLLALIQGYANGGDDVYGLASMLDDENWRCDIGPDDAINLGEDDRVDDVPGGFVVEIYPDCNVPEDVFEQGANDIEWFYQDNRDMDRHFFGVRFAEVLGEEDEEDGDDEEGVSVLALRYEQSTYELGVHETSLSIGRDTACELVVTEQPVSRRHARIERRGDGFVLIDQSTNGTWLYPEGEDEIVLRQEEAPLIGQGSFSLGHPAKEGLPSVAYFITQ